MTVHKSNQRGGKENNRPKHADQCARMNDLGISWGNERQGHSLLQGAYIKQYLKK